MLSTSALRPIWVGLSVYLLAVLMAAPLPARAQDDLPPPAPATPTRFEMLSQEDGLSQNSVLALLQDRQGFLWVGTQEGLNRYDGYGFTVYKNDPDNANSLSHSSILALHEDHDGILWIGTWGGGLNRFDPASGQFTRYRHDPDAPASLASDIVSSIYQDRDGLIWLGTQGGGLARFDPITAALTSFRHNPDDPVSIASDYIAAIAPDGAGGLWLGTGGYGMPGAGMDHFDPRTSAFTHYRHDPADAASLSSDNIAAIASAGGGKLWVGTGGYGLPGNGLNLFDPAAGKVVRYRHDPADPNSLAQDNIAQVYIDRNGQAWITTWGGGLDRIERSGDGLRFVHHRHDPFNPSSLSTDITWSILEDRSGLLWIGTINGGLNKINPQMQQFGLFRNHPNDPASLGHDVIGGLYEDAAGKLWIGTWGGGFDIFDRTTGAFTHFRHDPADPASLADDTVNDFYTDKRGATWIATMGGLERYDPATGTFTHFRHNAADANSPASDNILVLLPEGEDRLWVATLDGLDLLDLTTGEFTHFRNDPADPSSLPNDQVVELARTADGALWIGTWYGGLAMLDPEAWSAGAAKFVRYQHDPDDPRSLPEGGVLAVHEDRLGRLWIGAESGLSRLNRQTGVFTTYREASGLPNNTVLCILEDDIGNLWFSTNNGLVRMNPILVRFRTYDASHGLQSNEFDSGACLRSRNGEMYFGGVRGFNVFRPEQIKDNSVPPPVVVTGFRIFNRPVTVDLTGATPIDLTYRENFVSFDFAALDYHAPAKNRYVYQLEGFDDEWIDAEDRRFAAYTNLPGGDYVFRVRGANNDGVWNEAGSAIPLRVTPPLWEMWWFRGLGLVLFLGIVAAGAWGRVHQVRAQNRRLEQQVDEQTAALRHEIEQRRLVEATLAQKAAEEAVVAERTRLARDLHDAVTQTLFSASLTAEVLPALWAMDPAEGRKATEELGQLTRGALAEMRTLLLELRPATVTQAKLDDLIRQLVEAQTGRARLPIRYTCEGQRGLPDDVKIALYRIAQESLNNVAKYARASEVTVDLRQQPHGVRLTVTDNGVGFDPAAVGAGHMGQRIMLERAEAIGARLSVHSEPGQGTTMTVTWLDPEWNETESEEQ